MELVRDRHGSVLVLTPKGRLDNDNAAEFELAAQELLDAGERHVVVNLAELNYASNAGLRVLGKMGKALKTPATSLRLCGLTPAMRQVFDAAGIATLFDVRPDLKSALADHPGAIGAGELGRSAARLLGVSAASATNEPTPEPIKALAALAADILVRTGAGVRRAAKPMVDATALTPKVRAAVLVEAPRGGAVSGKTPWWKRLFGGKST